MGKFILATAVSIMLSGSASAADKFNNLQHAAAKIAVYGMLRAPLDPTTSQMVDALLGSMSQAERTQALAAETVLAKNYKREFCEAVGSDIATIEHRN